MNTGGSNPRNENSKMNFSDKSILIIEDDEVFRKFLSKILKIQFNVEIYEARDPVQALEILQNNSISIVILDMEMPKMDGFTFLKKIRAIPEFRYLPVIACSALRTPELVIELGKLGIADYIAKPAYANTILSKVYKVLLMISRDMSEKNDGEEVK